MIFFFSLSHSIYLCQRCLFFTSYFLKLSLYMISMIVYVKDNLNLNASED